MASYNKVILMGHLTRDPQAGQLPSTGSSFCEFGLAVNRSWKDNDGNTREEVLFIDCTAYGKTAETLAQYLRKGRPIHIEGRLKLDRWEQDGRQRSKIRVIVEQFRFVDSKATDEGKAEDAAPANAEPPKRTSRSKRREPVAAGSGGKDDIPF